MSSYGRMKSAPMHGGLNVELFQLCRRGCICLHDLVATVCWDNRGDNRENLQQWFASECSGYTSHCRVVVEGRGGGGYRLKARMPVNAGRLSSGVRTETYSCFRSLQIWCSFTSFSNSGLFCSCVCLSYTSPAEACGLLLLLRFGLGGSLCFLAWPLLIALTSPRVWTSCLFCTFILHPAYSRWFHCYFTPKCCLRLSLRLIAQWLLRFLASVSPLSHLRSAGIWNFHIATQSAFIWPAVCLFWQTGLRLGPVLTLARPLDCGGYLPGLDRSWQHQWLHLEWCLKAAASWSSLYTFVWTGNKMQRIFLLSDRIKVAPLYNSAPWRAAVKLRNDDGDGGFSRCGRGFKHIVAGHLAL